MSGRLEVAWVLTIGDELLRGEIVDSNKSYLSERLLRLDLETARHVTVGDDPEEIEAQLRSGAATARVILVSGGLGPTRDDITTEVVASTSVRYGEGYRRISGGELPRPGEGLPCLPGQSSWRMSMVILILCSAC